MENPQNVYLVHRTNFFPRNHKILCNYDGKKYFCSTGYMYGIQKYVTLLSKRKTVHFVQNNIVRSNSGGDWDDLYYTIVEPIEPHLDQIVVNYVGDTFTYGSVELSKDAVIFVRKDKMDILTDEDKNNFNIVYYEGNISDVVFDFLKSKNADIKNYDTNAAVHASTVYSITEKNLVARDKIIAYIRNNNWDGESYIELSFDEMEILARQLLNSSRIIPVTEQISEITNISPAFISLYFNFGLTFKNGIATICSVDESLQRNIIFDQLNRYYCSKSSIDMPFKDYFTEVMKENNIELKSIRDYLLNYNEFFSKKDFKPSGTADVNFVDSLNDANLYLSDCPQVISAIKKVSIEYNIPFNLLATITMNGYHDFKVERTFLNYSQAEPYIGEVINKSEEEVVNFIKSHFDYNDIIVAFNFCNEYINYKKYYEENHNNQNNLNLSEKFESALETIQYRYGIPVFVLKNVLFDNMCNFKVVDNTLYYSLSNVNMNSVVNKSEQEIIQFIENNFDIANIMETYYISRTQDIQQKQEYTIADLLDFRNGKVADQFIHELCSRLKLDYHFFVFDKNEFKFVFDKNEYKFVFEKKWLEYLKSNNLVDDTFIPEVSPFLDNYYMIKLNINNLSLSEAIQVLENNYLIKSISEEHNRIMDEVNNRAHQ